MKKNISFLLVFIFSVLFLTHAVYAAPPTGFQTTKLLGTELDTPTSLAVAPDGRIFITQQNGQIKIFKNGQLLSRNFDELPALASGDRGLLGIAFDPNFDQNHYVYFHYVGTDTYHHVVRFDASDDIGKDGPVEIYSVNHPSDFNHAGGAIQFGPDGKLYLALGDNGFGGSANAQDLSNPYGKIIRINKDGTTPSDNPFVGQSGKLPEIWAYGLRNPFRFQFDQTTGDLYVADVGQDSWEEINKVVKGGNYGWPQVEGMCTTSCASYINPIYAYPHSDPGYAVIGGMMYRGNMFPNEYKGSYFLGDYVKGFIKRLTFDQSGSVQGAVDFDPSAGAVVDMKTAQDGSIYYLTIFPGGLYHITYTTGDQLPVAAASADTTSGSEPLTVHFSSNGSADPDGTQISYLWDFGDNTASTEANPVKTYNKRGRYNATLTASDGVYSVKSSPVVIQVGTPPQLSISSPNDGAIYKAGDTISYSATATDWQSNAIPDSGFTTEVIFHHNMHVHPFIRPSQGRTGTFTIPTTGETSADTWYEIKISSTDQDGLVTTKSVYIYPKKVNLTFQTNPQNLKVEVDGSPQNTPLAVQGVVGIQRSINAPDQVVGQVPYEFDSWSDGGNANHQFTTPDTDTTYAATFKQAQPFVGQYFNNTSLSGTPILVRNDNLIDFNWGAGSPDPSINTDNFSARWTKTKKFIAGRYKFTTTTDDGVRLYIDKQKVIDHWADQGSTDYTAVADIPAGDHEIIMEYFDHTADAVAKLRWDITTDPTTFTLTNSTPTPTPTSTDSYHAEYFDNRYLQGQAELVRDDSAINFDWSYGSPDASIPNDNFSARWTKTVQTDDGDYKFTIRADDGVRLFIDNSVVYDQWKDQSPTTDVIYSHLTAGSHKLVLEYYEHGGTAVASMQYDKADIVPAQFSAQYFDNISLTGSPKVTRSESAINHEWGGGSPDAQIPSDNFSARWIKTDYFVPGIYSFNVTADDGVRLFIDDVLVLDKWKDQSTTYTIDALLSSGNHTIKMEYFEHGGEATAKLSYNKATGFTANYWNLSTFSSPPTVPLTTPTLTRIDDQIQYDWGSSSPDVSIQQDHFIGQWLRSFHLDSGNYLFSIRSDDGIRIYIDNALILDQWNDHSATDYSFVKSLSEGSHDIKIEYYENGGDAVAKFSFKKVSTPPTTFTGQYFSNQNFSGQPQLTREDAAINFLWGAGSPSPEIPSDHFSARWTKQEAFSADGDYTFILTSDDGVRFWIDNQLIVDDWNDHPPKTYNPLVHISAGTHTIKIEYYESGGDATMQFREQ